MKYFPRAAPNHNWLPRHRLLETRSKVTTQPADAIFHSDPYYVLRLIAE
jgi:hypothetical protein